MQTAQGEAGKISLLPQYGSIPVRRRRKDKAAPVVVPIVIDDPYALELPAVLREPPRRAKTRSYDAVEWIVPMKAPIEVLASRRDAIAGMWARHQIDHAMFLAARDYERTYATAMALPIKTVDPSTPFVNGRMSDDDRIDSVADASGRLARAEKRLAREHGVAAMTFCREVLGQGLTLERAACRRGDGDQERVRWWGGMLRRCLQELAEAMGYAVKGAYRNRRREDRRREAMAKKRERIDRGKEKQR